MGRRTIRAIIGFVIALSIVVGAAAWQLYGDAAMPDGREMGAATGRRSIGVATESGLAEQPRPAAVQASEVDCSV